MRTLVLKQFCGSRSIRIRVILTEADPNKIIFYPKHFFGLILVTRLGNFQYGVPQWCRYINNILCFQYFLSELKRLVRSNIEKLPLSSKNYAAVFRKKKNIYSSKCFLININSEFQTQIIGLKDLANSEWDLHQSCKNLDFFFKTLNTLG